MVVRVAPLPTLQSRGHDVTATGCVCPCSLPPEIIRLRGWEAAMGRNAFCWESPSSALLHPPCAASFHGLPGPVPRGGSSEICSPSMWAEGLRVWDSQAGGERSASGQVSGALESSLPKVPPVRRPVDQPSSQRRGGPATPRASSCGGCWKTVWSSQRPCSEDSI